MKFFINSYGDICIYVIRQLILQLYKNKRKMRCILFVLILLLVSCYCVQLMGETSRTPSVKKDTVTINALVDSARWGNGLALLQLADCYRDGKGVKRDFQGMLELVVEAEAHGGIGRVEDYIKNIPVDNNYRQMLELLSISRSDISEKKEYIEKISHAIDNPDAYAILGMLALEDNDTVRALDMLKTGEERGSVMAVMISSLYDMMHKGGADVAKLEAIAESSPIAFQYLAKDSREKGDYRKCAEYLLRAEEKAMLDKMDACWLLDYCKQDKTLQLSDEDKLRIESFAGVGVVDE